MSVSAATIEVAYGQILTISEVSVRHDDAGRVLGTYVTLFIPYGLDDAPPASATPEPPAPPAVGAPAPSPPDPTEEAKRLLAESGLTAPSSPTPTDSGAPPSDVGAAEGGSIRDLLPRVRDAGKYPLLCRRAATDLGIGNINGELSPLEEEQLRRLIGEILGS